jgi:hypothetical protein
MVLESKLGQRIDLITGIEMLVRMLIAIFLAQLSLVQQMGSVKAHYL